MALWFVVDRRSGRGGDRARAARAAGAQSVARRAVLRRQRAHGLSRPRRRRSRGHGSRSALRGHGSLRQTTDSSRVVRRSFFPRCLLNYFGQGALVLRDPSAASNPFYLLAPQCAALAARRARDDRRRDRITGVDLRRILAHAAERAARLLAARDDHPHVALAKRGRSIIPEVNNCLMVGCLLLVVAFRNLDRARRGVRHRRHGNDGDHVGALLCRRALALELVARAHRSAHARLSGRSISRSSRRERHQDRAWRLGAGRRSRLASSR